jgi:hypothetical protein
MRGQVRILQAKTALVWANDLVENLYIPHSKERYEIYETLIVKIAECMDQRNAPKNIESENKMKRITFYQCMEHECFT